MRPALVAVARTEHGRSTEARKFANTALLTLFPERTGVAQQQQHNAAAEHVMLSYNWDYQDTIKRINASLKARNYAVWIDVEKMQGSTIEA